MFVGGFGWEVMVLLGNLTVKPCAVVFATKALRHEGPPPLNRPARGTGADAKSRKENKK